MQEPPLMLGPVYLHWDGSYETYHAFFASHLRCKLDNINISGLEFGVGDLIVGSDEERALKKAVEICFPPATTLLCCQHLEENMQQRLQNKVSVPAEVRQDIVRRVWC